MQRRYTGNITCHLALKTRLWLRTYMLYQYKKYSLLRIVSNFLKINNKKDGLDTLLKDFEKQKAPAKSRRAAYCSMQVLKKM